MASAAISRIGPVELFRHVTTSGSHLLYFRSFMSCSTIDPDIKRIYKNAISDRATRDMEPNRHGPCSLPHAVAGPCGNRRGDLTECRCPELDRMAKPHVRKTYETAVIERCKTLIEEQGRGPFTLKLTIFGSGNLLGEQILLFKLFHALQGKSGAIHVYFIDPQYASAVSRAAPGSPSHLASTGDHAAMAQFLKETALLLPAGITLEGAFFGSDTDYIKAATANTHFKHDLLIGADIEDNLPKIRQIETAVSSGQAPIVLYKDGTTGSIVPRVCALDPRTFSGRLDRCVKPDVLKQQEEMAQLLMITTAIVVGAVVISALIPALAPQRLKA